jgi:predicted membrane chloride channel (bestrophin family)
MSRYLVILNSRTLFAIIISIIVPIIAYRYNINYNVDLTLISIAIIFPLVFNIRGAFRRREKALEHLSLYRASLKTVENIILSSKLEMDEINQGSKLIKKSNEGLIDFLDNIENDTSIHDNNINQLFEFLNSKKIIIGNGVLQKALRFLKDSIDSADNLVAIHRHRTPISLKAYCLMFVYIFPLVYTPTIIFKIGVENPQYLTYFIVVLSEFILISLYNIQDQMEYPFDKEGTDDIDLEIFRMTRK